MQTEKINPRLSALLLFIVAVALIRVFNATSWSPVGNYTPIGAMALFSGACFGKKWKAQFFSLAILLLSDLAISTLVFQGRYGIMYSGWYWIYGIFALIVLLGSTIIKRITVGRVLVAAIVGASSHWLLADLTVWLGGSTDLRTMQPLARNWQGLMQCYLQGFPFFKNFLMGTLLYSGLLFGLYAWMRAQYPSLVSVKAKA
jgi:hypothetical protein